MRIAQVTAYFQPEFGYDEYYVSHNLAQLGHDVSVVTSDRIYPFKNVKKLLAEIGSEYTTRKRKCGIEKTDGFTVYRLPTVTELFLEPAKEARTCGPSSCQSPGNSGWRCKKGLRLLYQASLEI